MIVVSQSRLQMRGLFGFLVVAFAAALARGVTGATTTAGRVAVAVIFGALLVGFVAALATAGRRLDRIEVATEAITYVRWSGQQKSVLSRAWGEDLRFVPRRYGGRFWVNCLNIRGTDKEIVLLLFSRKAVERACVARGWRFGSAK